MPNSSKNDSYVSFAGHGVDVAVNRADDLDKLSLVHFSKKNAPSVLDLGSGAGGHSIRMAMAGARVVAVDRHDFSSEFSNLIERLVDKNNLDFICGNVINLKEILHERRFSDVYMQRVLHYLKYDEALSLLKYLNEITEDSMFVSVMGIGTGAGIGYLGNDVDIRNRYYKLSSGSIEKYSIHEPVCLYSKEEFINLLEEAGWKVESCWASAFGNIKAVCSH